jgi:hypothetical protein
MKKIAVIILFFILVSGTIAAESREGFEKSTQINAIANGTLWGLETGLSLDLSTMPHIAGTFAFTGATGLSPFGKSGPFHSFEAGFKFYMRPDNLGTYASLGPIVLTSMIMYPVGAETPPFHLGYLKLAVGYRALFFEKLNLDISIYVPSSLLFELGDFPGLDAFSDIDTYVTSVAFGAIRLGIGVSF